MKLNWSKPMEIYIQSKTMRVNLPEQINIPLALHGKTKKLINGNNLNPLMSMLMIKYHGKADYYQLPWTKDTPHTFPNSPGKILKGLDKIQPPIKLTGPPIFEEIIKEEAEYEIPGEVNTKKGHKQRHKAPIEPPPKPPRTFAGGSYENLKAKGKTSNKKETKGSERAPRV